MQKHHCTQTQRDRKTQRDRDIVYTDRKTQKIHSEKQRYREIQMHDCTQYAETQSKQTHTQTNKRSQTTHRNTQRYISGDIIIFHQRQCSFSFSQQSSAITNIAAFLSLCVCIDFGRKNTVLFFLD